MPIRYLPLRLVVLCAMALVASVALAQTPWRSSLYPSNWTPPASASFENDKLLQDFSFAGYRRGDTPIPTVAGPVYDVTTYGADPTGSTDSTLAIQAAIDAASTAGGGVVYMPAGTFRVSLQGSNTYALRIAANGVVLRGAGPTQTFLCNDSHAMRNRQIIRIEGSSLAWTTVPGSSPNVEITADLLSPTTVIPVSDVSGFAVGDWVIVRAEATNDFVAEHNMADLWSGQSSNLLGIQYLRQVVAIDAAASTLTIDVPTRYYLKMRDQARVHRAVSHVEEVGLEDFAIANRQHPNATVTTGWAENDYDTTGTGAYDVHGSYVVVLRRARNCWISNVQTYRPAVNTLDTHILSNGILIDQSRGVTVRRCDFQRPLYGGGGGNGYMYRLQRANECLLQDCAARYMRHGFVFASMATSGNVIHGGIAQVTRMQSASGTPGGEGNDHHMHLSHSNLIDGVQVDRDYFTAHYRGTSGSPAHGHAAAHSVFWNTAGLAYFSTRTSIVRSEQARYGYVIGTRGPANGISTQASGGTRADPEDHTEGEGQGDTLEPLSLYHDQLARRLSSTPVPPVPTAVAAAPGHNQITLTWFSASSATSYDIYRSLSEGGPYTLIANVAGTEYVDLGLTNETTYYYVVSARNATGASGLSYEASAKARPAFMQDAGANGIVAVETENYDGNLSQGNRTWTFVTSPAGYSGTGAMQALPGSNATHDSRYTGASPRLDYRIHFVHSGTHYLWVRGSGPSATDDSIHVGLNGIALTTSDKITGFPTTWGWRRTRIDAPIATIEIPSPGLHTVNIWMREDGVIVDKLLLTVNSAYVPSGVGPAESPRTPTSPPAPTDLVALAASTSEIDLGWSPTAGARSYVVKRSTADGGPYMTLATNHVATTYSDTGLSPSTTYYYVVSAVDTAGESPNSDQASATTLTPQPPPAPGSLSAVVSDATVVLAWAPSSGATSYQVMRSTASGGPYSVIGITSGTELTDATVQGGTTYYYVVTATNAHGEGPGSAEASAIIPAVSTFLPPTELAAAQAHERIVLRWRQPARADLQSNKVYRATTSGGPYTLLATFNARPNYRDVVASGITYYYVVTAVSNDGIESPYSNEIAATAR